MAESNAYQPKWRVFHPQSTVWVRNPFKHDVIFQVADERDIPYQYKIRAGADAELPGGAVATLGVKRIVDELIQNNKEEVLRINDQDVRQKYESQIIIRFKEAPVRPSESAQGGEIDLSDKLPEGGANYDPAAQDDEEEAFPGLNQPPQPAAANLAPTDPDVSSVANASLPVNPVGLIESD